MIFAEALTTLEEYKSFVEAVGVPVLANITEFGQTPFFSTQELKKVGVEMALYPLSAFRAMSLAAQNTYNTIREMGSQQTIVEKMQTRDELYEILNYRQQENLLSKE